MKATKRIIFLLILISLGLQFCGGVRYAVPDFHIKTAHHRTIAVLPFEMVFIGKKPKKLSHQQVAKLREVESIAFQKSFYSALMHHKIDSSHPIRIDIQPVGKTNRILDRHGISIRDSWAMDPQELAHLLRVDAVVRTRVEKRRYMSDLASFGIEVGNVILNLIQDDFRLFVDNSNKDIMAECFILDGGNGEVVWATDLAERADWKLPANEIVDHFNYHLARRFPYR